MKPIFEMFDDPINAMGYFDFKYVRQAYYRWVTECLQRLE